MILNLCDGGRTKKVEIDHAHDKTFSAIAKASQVTPAQAALARERLTKLIQDNSAGGTEAHKAGMVTTLIICLPADLPCF